MPEVDEFGIPIKKAQVDEFGIPIKKKDGGEPKTPISTSQYVSPLPQEELPLGIPQQKRSVIQEAQTARERINKSISESDDILTRLIRENRLSAFETQQQAIPQLDGSINPAAQSAKRFLITQSPVTPDEVVAKKQEALSNDNTARQVISRVAKKDPTIASSVYLVDAQSRANAKKEDQILSNADKIANGELTYNINKGILQQPQGVIESGIRGFKERSRQLDDYEKITNAVNQEEKIRILEEGFAGYDPDKPVPVPEGAAAQFSEMLFMEGVPMLKSAAAATITGLIPGAQPAIPLVAAFASSPEYYKRSYESAIRSAYYELRKRGKTPEEALAVAEDQAQKEGVIGAAEGAVSSALGARIGFKPASIVQSPVMKGALEKALIASGNTIKQMAPEAAADAGAAGLLQIASNLTARDNGLDRGVLDGVQENIAGEVGFTIGMGVLTKGGRRLVDPNTYRTILNGFARQPKVAIDEKIGEMVVAGAMTPEDAADVSRAIEMERSLDAQIPKTIPETVRPQISEMIEKRNDLKQQLASANEAFHPTIKEEINSIDQQILSYATNESQVQEGRAEGDIVQPQGTLQGQPEVGQGAGGQGQTQITPANVSDSNIGSQGQVEDEAIIEIPKEDQVKSETIFRKPIYSKGVLSYSQRREVFNANKDNIKVEDVDVNSISPTQSVIDGSNISSITDEGDLPILVRDGDNLFVLDGHHRIAAGIKNGATSVRARIINAPELSNIESVTPEQKKEVIKQKFDFITDQDFVQESFTQEEDAADRSTLPDSGFANEQEFKNFLETGEYAMLTGQNPEATPVSKEANKKLNDRAQEWLSDRGLRAIPIFGKYENSERSFMVPDMTKSQAIEFAKDFSQDSVAHSTGLVFKDGSFNPRQDGVVIDNLFDKGEDNFSSINISGSPVDFKIRFDFDTTIPSDAAEKSTMVEELLNEVFNTPIEKARQSLSPTGVDIQVVSDPAEYDAQVEQLGGQRGTEGVFLSNEGKILLNEQKLKEGVFAGRIIWHEASHPVMNIVRNTNPDLYNRVLSGLKQVDNPSVKQAIQWANDNYEGQGTIDDESIVETVAMVADGTLDLDAVPTGLKQSIIDFINLLARALGFNQVLNDTDVAAFKKLAGQIADALTSGRNIGEVVGRENVKEYMSNLESPELVGGGSISVQPRTTESAPVNVYESKETEVLPKRSLQEVYDQYEGKAVVINSDPTRVGELTLPSGKKIFMYGGPGYLSLKDNVSGNVGFATTQIGKVNTWMKYVNDLFGDKPGVTLVATQAPTSILSNSYALRYVMDGISQLPKSVLRSSDFKNEFFGKDLVLLKDAFGEKAYNEFVSKYKKADLSNPTVIDGMISEMAYKVGDDNNPASFKARGAFVSNLLGGIEAKKKLKTVEGEVGYVSKKPTKYISGQLFNRLGINAEKVIREIGEPSLVDLYMNEGKWGMAVSGFETDPAMTVESVQAGGVKHPLFNAKFPGKNAFVLDGAYDVNQMFSPIEMTGPSGAPYTKTAGQMLAGSMYVKGQPVSAEGSFQYQTTPAAGGAIQASSGGRDLTGKINKKLTDDGQGNYVFFHYSGKKLNKIDPSKFGANLATGRDERPGVGLSMYYVDNKTLETGVPSDFGYAVRIPKDKVYPFNEDPLNFYDQAKAEFEKDYPGQSFDANKQIGYITKVAGDNGFDITVADWNIKGRKALRAQTTKSLKPEIYKQKVFKNGSEREQFNEELQKLKPGVQASAGNRPENNANFKLGAFVMRKKAEGATDGEIAIAIASVTGMKPEDIKTLIDNPEQYIRDMFPSMTKLQQDNLIEKAKIQNIYRGRQFGKPIDKAFTGLEVPQEYVDEYMNKTAKSDNAVKEWATDFKRKWLDPAKGLPDWVLAIKDFASGSKNIEIARASKTIERLKDEAKKIGFTDWNAFGKALVVAKDVKRYIPNEDGVVPFDAYRAAAGKMFTTPDDQLPALVPDEIKALPDEIIPYVYAMRGQIDNLTRDLIGNGYVTPEQAVNLENNIGEYVNRSYRMFNEMGYKPEKEVKNAAVKFLADSYVKEIATDKAGTIAYKQAYDEAIEKAKKEVDTILLSRKKNPYFNASTDRRNTGILQERKDIPEPLRKLMGEYTDPGTVFMMTVAKQAALKASSQYLNKLRENGMGTLFFEQDDPSRPLSHSVQIASPGSESMNPLGGLFTTPEIAEAIDMAEPTYNNFTQVWMKLVGAVRWGKTVGSIATQFKNFESNLGFAVLNGYLMSGQNTAAFKASAKYVKGQYSKAEIDTITDKAIRLGLVGQSVGARELKEMLGSGDVHDIALDIALGPDGKWGKKVAKKLNVFKEANKLYRLGDDFWKVYAYMTEREQLSDARFNSKYEELTKEQQDQIDAESSERVKNTWPTYDRVVELAKVVSKNAPIFGNFISFQAESLRVLANSIKLAKQDMADPQLRHLGVRRAVGIAAYFGLRSAITIGLAKTAGFAAAGVLGAAFGDDEEERNKRAIKQALPPFMRTSDLAVIKTKEPHKFTVISLSSLDPYAIIPNSLNAYTEGREGIFGKTMDPGVAAATAEIFSSFLEPEMTFNTMWSTLNNIDPKTKEQIVLGNDTNAQAAVKVGGKVWDMLEPSSVALVQRFFERKDKEAEILAIGGARPYDVDLHKSFGYILSQFGKDVDAINREYNSIKYKEGMSQQEKDAAEMSAEDKKAFAISKLNETYRDFMNLGADPKVLNELINQRSSIKMTGFDKNTKKFIKTGNINKKNLFK